MKHKQNATVIIYSLLLLAALTALDQYIKHLAAIYLKYSPVILIKDVFSLRYLENRGIGFGLFQGKVPLILVFNIIVLFVILLIIVRLPANKRMMPIRITLLFTVAGALGNIIDRLRLGYVIDFLSFDLIHFPIFNLADIFVTVSIVMFAVLYLFYCKPGELENVIFHRDQVPQEK